MARAIDQAIYTQLISDQSSTSAFALVNGRISASYGDPGEDFPLITFEQVSDEVTKEYGGGVMMHNTVYEISIFGRWEDGLAELIVATISVSARGAQTGGL
jgi:hypothetical protein